MAAEDLTSKLFLSVPGDGKCFIWAIFLGLMEKNPSVLTSLGINNILEFSRFMYNQTKDNLFLFDNTTYCENEQVIKITRNLNINVIIYLLNKDGRYSSHQFIINPSLTTIEIVLYQGHYYLIYHRPDYILDLIRRNIIHVQSLNPFDYNIYLEYQNIFTDYFQLLQSNTDLTYDYDEQFKILQNIQQKYIEEQKNIEQQIEFNRIQEQLRIERQLMIDRQLEIDRKKAQELADEELAKSLQKKYLKYKLKYLKLKNININNNNNNV